MITFDQIKKLMTNYKLEIAFSVSGSDKFKYCWMGKMSDDITKEDVYWFGLTEDGKNAFDYPTFEELSSAMVFDGRTLFELWDNITVLEINACDPEEYAKILLN